MNKHLALSALFMGLLLAPKAMAQTLIYDNGAFVSSNAWEITSFAHADDFTLASTQTFDLARVWLVDLDLPFATFNGFSGTLSWFVYSDAAGAPGGVLASGTASGAAVSTADTGIDLGSYRVFQVDFSLPSTTLGAGNYWFRVKENGLTTPADGSEIFWLDSGSSTGLGTRQDTNPASPTTWATTIPEDRAFQLFASPSATAPEPGSLLLLLLGGSLVRLKRR